MDIINPSNNKVISKVEIDTEVQVQEMYIAAKKQQKVWKNTPIKERIAAIKKFAELIIEKENRDELASILTSETGKPLQESYNEINGAAVKCQFFIAESEKYLLSKIMNSDGNTQEILSYDPLGVITNISAWNYPYLVGVNIFIPALITGNAVLYKPSEFSTLTGQQITKFLHLAGIPENIFKMVTGDGKVGEYLLDLPLDGYFFTGSYPTGKRIAEAVASKLVPVGLELGGKDPLYITDEVVDIEKAAESAVEGTFYNNGQSCCSVERIYVHQKMYNQFKKNFIEKVKSLKVGDPTQKENSQGAITRKAHLSYLNELVIDATEKGATLEVGGSVIDSAGNFFEPTVLSNVNHEMRCMQEETFGPVIGIQEVANDEEAITLMNDTEFGLTSSVFSSNQERGEKILKQVNSGTGYLNCCDRVSGHLPWSGRGHSGLGTTLSPLGIWTFTNPKGYHIRTL